MPARSRSAVSSTSEDRVPSRDTGTRMRGDGAHPRQTLAPRLRVSAVRRNEACRPSLRAGLYVSMLAIAVCLPVAARAQQPAAQPSSVAALTALDYFEIG